MDIPRLTSARGPLCAVILAAFTLTACQGESEEAGQQQQPAPTVTVATPVVKEVREEDEFVGRFAAVDDVSVRSRVNGYLNEVHFTDGQMVEAGDRLFTIDQREFEAELASATARLESATSALEFAQSEFDRSAELVDRGTIPVSTFEEDRNRLMSAQSEEDQAEAAKRRAELDMDFTEIRAPVGGRIDRNLISVGNLIRENETVLTSIVSLDPIEFYFDIDERTLIRYARDARERGNSLQSGTELEVVVTLADDIDGSFTGTLDFAENRVDQASGTIRLRARFDNPDFILQPGMFGRVVVPGSLPYRAVMIPDEAIASDQNRRIVYTLGEDNSINITPIRPGPTIDGYRVVREGLEGDETLVVNGLARVRPGITVNPETTELPPVAEAAS